MEKHRVQLITFFSHKKYGELHAERNAIASLTESAEGAVIYVTLEPCCHHGIVISKTMYKIQKKPAEISAGWN